MKKPEEKLRVVMLAPTRVQGGITTWLRSLLKASDSRRVEYRVIDTSKVFDPLGKRLNVVGAVLGVRDAFRRFLQLLWTVLTFRPHLVHFTCAPSIGFIARDCPIVVLLRVLGVPSVLHLHGGKVEGFFGGGFLRRRIARLGARSARAVLAITRPVENASAEIVGRGRVFYVPNMIDEDWLTAPPRRIVETPPAGRFRLLNVAWQAPEKGSLDLVQALGMVRSPVECQLVGVCAEENRRQIEPLIARLGPHATARLVGVKRGKDLRAEFEAADLFVFPSHFEGFPMAVLEAMAAGISIVATDVGNIREMIGADTDSPAGVLLDRVNPVDPSELARKIDDLLTSPRQRRVLSGNGIARVKALYQAGKVVPELERLLEHIARGPLGR